MSLFTPDDQPICMYKTSPYIYFIDMTTNGQIKRSLIKQNFLWAVFCLSQDGRVMQGEGSIGLLGQPIRKKMRLHQLMWCVNHLHHKCLLWTSFWIYYFSSLWKNAALHVTLMILSPIRGQTNLINPRSALHACGYRRHTLTMLFWCSLAKIMICQCRNMSESYTKYIL